MLAVKFRRGYLIGGLLICKKSMFTFGIGMSFDSTVPTNLFLNIKKYKETLETIFVMFIMSLTDQSNHTTLRKI